MVLTGNEIHNQIIAGNIEIDPFDPNRLNPNSYNLSLGSELAVYKDLVLDMRKKSELVTIPIPGFSTLSESTCRTVKPCQNCLTDSKNSLTV